VRYLGLNKKVSRTVFAKNVIDKNTKCSRIFSWLGKLFALLTRLKLYTTVQFHLVNHFKRKKNSWEYISSSKSCRIIFSNISLFANGSVWSRKRKLNGEIACVFLHLLLVAKTEASIFASTLVDSESWVGILSPAMGRGIDSRNRVWNWVAKLHWLAGRYDNPMPTWFLVPIAGLKLPALI
jgi:hypothetical protein